MNVRDQIEAAYTAPFTEVALLYHVAEDGEAQVLDDLRRRAGITWEHDGCWTNMAEDGACESCGTLFSEIPEYERSGEPRAAALVGQT